MAYEEKPKAGTEHSRRTHNLSMEGRQHLSVSGVEDVESFDEQEIVMLTGMGNLVVTGEQLSVSRLSVESGDVTVQGKITELRYEEPSPGRTGFFARLFH